MHFIKINIRDLFETNLSFAILNLPWTRTPVLTRICRTWVYYFTSETLKVTQFCVLNRQRCLKIIVPVNRSGQSHIHWTVLVILFISLMHIPLFLQWSNGHNEISHLLPSNPSLHSHLNSWLPFMSKQFFELTPMF